MQRIITLNPFVLFIALLFLSFQGLTQDLSRLDIPFEVYGKNLKNPLTGGFNAPQFSEGDLNNDGILDLYIFDRVGNVHVTFLNDGVANASGYTYAPEYAKNFPDSIRNFALLRDFDQDGIHDLFSYSVRIGVPGVAVFKGYYDGNNQIAFDLLHDVIFYPGTTNNLPVNMAVLNIDIPDINDVDCDGDLDVLTFDIGGGYVDWYRNYSVENGHGLDSLQFRLEENCWGGIYESGFVEEIDLADSPGECANNVQDDSAEERHAGSTLLTFDTNDDDALELFLGDVSFPHIAMLVNGGTCTEAWMNDQDIDFPSYDVPASMHIFPASFYLDVNNDGLKDVLVAPNNNQSIEDTENIWFYRNSTSNEFPIFELQQKDLFSGETIDLGTSSSPAFVDYNADGLLDLVVGNDSEYTPSAGKDPHLFLYENVGTSTAPAYKLVDDNWLNFNQFASSSYYFSPTFGDLDGDGDVDLLVGEQQGHFFYAENTAGPGNPVSYNSIQPFYQGLDTRNVSRPTIYDFNQDGLMDIIAGERNGVLNYFENYGSIGNPVFEPKLDTLNNTNLLGQINTREDGYFTGFSAPNFITVENEAILVCGSQTGQIKVYNNLTDTLFNQLESAYGNIRDGANCALAIADIDNDNFYEVIMGNNRGGLTGFNTTWATVPVATKNVLSQSLSMSIFPNPSKGQARVEWEHPLPTKLTVTDQLGRVLFQQQNILEGYFDLNSRTFSKGLYFIRLETKTGSGVEKLLVF